MPENSLRGHLQMTSAQRQTTSSMVMPMACFLNLSFNSFYFIEYNRITKLPIAPLSRGGDQGGGWGAKAPPEKF